MLNRVDNDEIVQNEIRRVEVYREKEVYGQWRSECKLLGNSVWARGVPFGIGRCEGQWYRLLTTPEWDMGAKMKKKSTVYECWFITFGSVLTYLFENEYRKNYDVAIWWMNSIGNYVNLKIFNDFTRVVQLCQLFLGTSTRLLKTSFNNLLHSWQLKIFTIWSREKRRLWVLWNETRELGWTLLLRLIPTVSSVSPMYVRQQPCGLRCIKFG